MSITKQMDRNFSLYQEMAGIMLDQGEHEPHRTCYIRLVGELEAILCIVYAIHPETHSLIENKLEDLTKRMVDEIAAKLRKDPVE